MAVNSLLSCNPFCSGLKLLPPPHSSVTNRRSLLARPIMTADIFFPSSSIHLDGTPSIVSAESNAEPRDGQDGKSTSSCERSSASEMSTGIDLQLSSLSNASTWSKLVLGSLVLLSIPFLRRFLRTKDVVRKVEILADVVQETAQAVEKTSEGIAEDLPDGKLKEAALKLGKISSLIDKNAEATEYIIDKVETAVEELESDLKPIIQRIQAKKNDGEGNMTGKIAEDQSKE